MQENQEVHKHTEMVQHQHVSQRVKTEIKAHLTRQTKMDIISQNLRAPKRVLKGTFTLHMPAFVCVCV